jgi:hypothetical protein
LKEVVSLQDGGTDKDPMLDLIKSKKKRKRNEKRNSKSFIKWFSSPWIDPFGLEG